MQRILEIWRAGLGVVSLHVFQNVIASEAFTREACMIDALGELIIIIIIIFIIMSHGHGP